MNLSVQNLERRFHGRQGEVHALGPVSFEAGDAEFISFLGPSGCGKTTTLYLIAGLDAPSGGRILLDGEPVTGPGRDRGMVFQHYTLFPWLTVLENARFGERLYANQHYALPTNELINLSGRAEHLLDLMGMVRFFQAYPRELSGGMKQRVAIARTLAMKPKLVLMDEPFGALDAQTREEMQEMLLLLSRHDGTTILFVTHDVEEALYLSTRIFVFSRRPGTLLHDMTVPFGPDRTLALKQDAQFLRLKRELLDSLHSQQDDTARGESMKRLLQISRSQTQGARQ
jgi:NitT/TauT family transport system ATP-binding protein